MVRAASNSDPIAEVRFYLQGVAKSLVDRLFGPQGPTWGTTLSSLEATIASVRSALSEQMLTLALARQSAACSAQAQTEPVRCPCCQSPTQTNDPESRVVSTAVGWVQWSEPCHFCPKCRKAFFPSVGQPRA